MKIDINLGILHPAGPPSCPADLTNDGTLDFFDIAAFLTAFPAGCP
ncbi:MAG: hypothetical protein JKY43_08925 [Phycisphaerales bacterium]|nr:hypothetical protein [Phycisphaerales bacterium]